MLSSTIRTIVTGKASIGLASAALLGGGAVLAAPDSTPAEGVLAAVSTQQDGESAVVQTDADEPETPDPGPAEIPEIPLEAQEEDELQEDEPPATEEGPSVLDLPVDPGVTEEEDDGPGWALGRQDGEGDVEGASQQSRVEQFCAARMAEVGDSAENGDGEGVPPFCTTGEDGGEAVPPNAYGQEVAAAARGRDRAKDGDDAPGPPPGVGRPDGVPDDEDDEESAGPPEGRPVGPPAGVPGRGPRSSD